MQAGVFSFTGTHKTYLGAHAHAYNPMVSITSITVALCNGSHSTIQLAQ